MGEVTTDGSGLLPKIGALLNNKMFSDVEFLFLSDPTSKLYGHKLLLALRSDYFASRFYLNKESIQQIVLPPEEKQLFYCLLRFLYTDDVQFQGIDVEDLYAISNKYGVKELASKCLAYLSKERITVDNIFSKYDCGLNKNIETLLRNCRNFVCHEAETVFQSIHFNDAPKAVIEDILKQDDFSLSSEIIAINAVLRWGQNKCSKDQLSVDDKNLKECVYPFMKYLRFLTLSATEFQSIVEKYNIFSPLECTLLTCKIFQPQCNVDVPEYICSSNQKRGKFISNTASSPLFSKQEKYHVSEIRESLVSETRMEHKQVKINKQSSLAQNNVADTPQRYRPNPLQSSNDLYKNLDIDSLISSLSGPEKDEVLQPKLEKTNIVHKAKLSQSKYENPIDMLKMKSPTSVEQAREASNDLKYLQQLLDMSKVSSNNSKLPHSQSSFQYEIKKSTPFAGNNAARAQLKAPRGQSTPNISFGNHSHSNFSQDTGNRRIFEFFLIEGPPTLLDSFRRDIKCSVTFWIKSGMIQLYGFELYVKNTNDKSEKLEIDVDLKGFSAQFSSRTYRKTPVNNVFSILFDSPVLLHETKKGEVHISIDNLYLNRCRVCPSDRTICELNNGFNSMCDISIKSNQYAENQNGSYSLINRLFYNPC